MRNELNTDNDNSWNNNDFEKSFRTRKRNKSPDSHISARPRQGKKSRLQVEERKKREQEEKSDSDIEVDTNNNNNNSSSKDCKKRRREQKNEEERQKSGQRNKKRKQGQKEYKEHKEDDDQISDIDDFEVTRKRIEDEDLWKAVFNIEEEVNAEQLCKELDAKYNEYKTVNARDSRELACFYLGLNATRTDNCTFDSFSPIEIKHHFDMRMKSISQVYGKLIRGNKLPAPNDYKIQDSDLVMKLNFIFECLYWSKNLLKGLASMAALHDSQFRSFTKEPTTTEDETENNDTHLFQCTLQSSNEIEDLSKKQEAILFVLKQCAQYNLRKRGDNLYREIRTNDTNRFHTHAWEKFCSIESFITMVCDKDTHTKIWVALHSGNNAEEIRKYLEKCHDPECQTLLPDRTVTSWKDGIYFARTDTFYSYGDTRIPFDAVSCRYTDVSMKYNSDVKTSLDIHTRVSNKILRDQGYTPAEIQVILAMFGRIIYPLKEYDGWDLGLLMYGFAGTGKSTLSELLLHFFDHEYVAVVGNNHEKEFGMGSIYDKFVVAGVDIRDSFTLDPGELQSIISGEYVQINRKYMTAISMPWTSPVFFSCNIIPRRWVDQQNSLVRRMFLVYFEHPILEPDTSLKTCLFIEKGLFYRQCNLAYLEFARQYGQQDFWKVIMESKGKNPDQDISKFDSHRMIMRTQNNPLQQFLNTGACCTITQNPNDYILETSFIGAFNFYCEQHHFKAKTDSRSIEDALKVVGCQFKENVNLPWPTPHSSQFYRANYCIGLHLMDAPASDSFA